MGPFFYSKKEIPAKPLKLINLSLFRFLFEIPPRAIIFLFVNLDNNLNLFRPK